MIKNFIWTFSDTMLASGLNGAFSLEYHMPSSKMTVRPEDLIGSRLWLSVKSDKGTFLYALLNPTILEQYQEGKYKDDFLLQCEPFSSVRFLPRHESHDPWQMPFKIENGIRECSEDEHTVLFETIKRNHRIGFAPLSRPLLDNVPRTSFKDLESSVPDQLMNTLRTTALGDIPRPRSMPESLSPLGCVTLTILLSTHTHLNESEIIDLISRLDPFADLESGTSIKTQEEILRVLSILPPVVDTFLEEIDPEKISPRTFIARSVDSSLEWLDKTNDAEKNHEQILKDVVVYLKAQGFKVYKTRSIDLYAEKDTTQLLWEIKSANEYNSVMQGEKGIMQLLRYSSAFTSEKSAGIRFLLLLQNTGLTAVNEYLSKVAVRTGSELCLYDMKKECPGRISTSIPAATFQI